MIQQSKQTANYLRDLLAILSLGTLILACYWRIALAGRVLANGDIFTYFYPYWTEATRAIRAGRLPLWNPYLFMGAPFLANSQAGFFYPLNWPLWLLTPAHRAVHLTILLHLCLAASGAYLWGRASLRLGRLGAWTVGLALALGGSLGAQVEHINQLQGLAWLPLMLTLYDKARYSYQARRPFFSSHAGLAAAGLSFCVGLVLLAGHTQTAFISLVGLAAYGLGPALWRGIRCHIWKPLAHETALLAIAAGMGAMLAAVQLIPTWELSRFSVRAGGLPFSERVSFSLSPLYMARALLPRFVDAIPPDHIEYVAYVGIAGMALAAVAVHARGYITRNWPATLILLALGIFFSLGLYNPLYLFLARYVPGFAHFRAPARWLILYALGMAALAGKGIDLLWRRREPISRYLTSLFIIALLLLMVWAAVGVRLGAGEGIGWPTAIGWAGGGILTLGLLALAARAPRPAAIGLLALLLVELFAAASALPHTQATAPQAFTSLQPAIAHLLADDRGRPSARFLSMSDITFDPGDMSEITHIYGPQLSAEALYNYIVAAKHKEVLSPNLPLAFGLPAVDGFGGGLLPLARYITLQQLLMPPGGGAAPSIDGRLRESLTAIPDGRWLSLFNVQYIITDKLRDAWLDDVFYDLQWGAQLARGETAEVAMPPQFEANALGIVSYLRGGDDLPEGALIGHVEVSFDDGRTHTFELRAGEHTAAGLYGPDVVHAQAAVGGHFWPGRPEGNDYVARLRWSEPAVPAAILVRAALPQGELVVRGMSLIDERTSSFQSLVLSDRGRFRLVHSGDVKIYENLDVQPRAFLVHEAAAAGDLEALARMQSPTFDPAAEVILSASGSPDGKPASGEESARVTHYAPEHVEVEVKAQSPGYLILTDAIYPGWEATVDGASAPIRRADLLFRAVAVDAGSHRVIFTFRPASLYIGAGVSLAGLIVLIVGVLLVARAQRNRVHKPPVVQSQAR